MKKLWKRFKHWFCKVGLCNLDKCKSSYHKDKCCGKGCESHGEAKIDKSVVLPESSESHGNCCDKCGCALKHLTSTFCLKCKADM